MKELYRVLGLCAIAACAGCAAAPSGKTVRTAASGTPAATTAAARPEVTIANQSKKDVTDALVGEVVSRGFTVVAVTEYTAVFSKPIEAAAPSLSLKRGARSGGAAEQRLSFTIAKTGEGVRIVLVNQIVSNPGTAYERVTDAGAGPAGEGWRQFLASFPNAFKARVGMSVDGYGVVTNVVPGSPAQAAGIQTGDKIIRVDGAPYSGTSQLTGDPDTKVIVVVSRQGQELPFILYRKVLK
jgi:S1-C subfamily serine protease